MGIGVKIMATYGLYIFAYCVFCSVYVGYVITNNINKLHTECELSDKVLKRNSSLQGVIIFVGICSAILLFINCTCVSIFVKKGQYNILNYVNYPLLVIFGLLLLFWIVWCIQITNLSTVFTQETRKIHGRCVSFRDDIKHRIAVGVIIGLLPLAVLPCLLISMMKHKDSQKNKTIKKNTDNNDTNINVNDDPIPIEMNKSFKE